MKFQGKLMNRTRENCKRPYFRLDFGLLGQNVGPQNLFRRFYLYWSLEIVPSYHPMQFTGMLMNQT